MSLFLATFPAEATEQTLRTVIVNTVHKPRNAQFKPWVNVAKSKYVFPGAEWFSGSGRLITIRCVFVNFMDHDSAGRDVRREPGRTASIPTVIESVSSGVGDEQ